MQGDLENPNKMKISKKTQSFEACPEYTGKAVCVDVTPLRKTETAYGVKETFKCVFETTILRQDGSPYCVWSRGFTPSLHEKSAFAQFLKKWLGRSLTAAEEADFDTEDLVGRCAEITVVHEEGRNGEVYANIALIRPDRTGKPLAASGKFVRAKDRAPRDAEFRRTEEPAPAPKAEEDRFDWQSVRIHVGNNKGIDLGDLDRAGVMVLIKNWLPEVKKKERTTADDRRLMFALEAADAEIRDEDNIPMGNRAF
jgi:hypothetical protein